jgi:hypothetical protein
MTTMHVARWLIGAGASLLLACAPGSAAADTYTAAAVDSSGVLRIQRGNGAAIVVARDSAQVEFDRIAISKDGRCVGWLALYPNCCTSYPIPLHVRVIASGRLRTFGDGSLAISRWKFIADGRRIAFEQETVHGGFGVHYELRDVRSGRLVAQFDPPTDRDGRPRSGHDVPAWVAELDGDRGAVEQQ